MRSSLEHLRRWPPSALFGLPALAFALACALEPTQFLGGLAAVLSGVAGLLAVLFLLWLRGSFALRRGWSHAFHPAAPDAPRIWNTLLAAALCTFLVLPASSLARRLVHHRARAWLETLASRIDEHVRHVGRPPRSLEELGYSRWTEPWLSRLGKIEYRPHADGSFSFELASGTFGGWNWHSATRRWSYEQWL
jgi:hypothetical protein